jgi:hypothetical protein
MTYILDVIVFRPNGLELSCLDVISVELFSP